MIAWDCLEGRLALKEAAKEFVTCDWCQSGLSYLIPAAEVVEQLAYRAPTDLAECAELEARVMAFFWEWLDDATAPAESPFTPKVYPL